MSKITIDYSDILNASRKAKSAADDFEDYANELKKKIKDNLTDLPGSDSQGNIGGTLSIVNNKIKEINGKKDYYKRLSTNISNLKDKIESREITVVSKIRTIGEDALELKKRSKWECVRDFLYGTFCVDLVNSNAFTRAIGNFIKKVNDWGQKTLFKIENWFKHGQGKYYLGIIFDLLAVAGAVIGAISAVALAIATGGAAILVVAAVAACIGAVMTSGDAICSITNKIKAIKITNKTGDPGRARYYGDVSGVSDTIGKYDLGGKEFNETMEKIGTGYDHFHTVANVTAAVAGTVGAAGLNGRIVKDPITGKAHLEANYNPIKARMNLGPTIKENLGFRYNAITGKWNFSLKNLLTVKKSGLGKISGTYKESLLNGYLGRETNGVLKSIKNFTKIKNVKTAYKTVYSSGYSRVKNGIKMISNSDIGISSPAKDFDNLITPLLDIFFKKAS